MFLPLSNETTVTSRSLLLLATAMLIFVAPLRAQDAEPVSTNLFLLEEIVVRAEDSAADLDTSLIQSRTLLDAAELQLKVQPSLGDTLIWEPGVTSSSFGPGSSRPVIRGFSGDRVRMLSDGVGTGDISQTAADHAVTADSLLSESIEVVRGPASLEFGGSAIGGVVNVRSKAIPRHPPARWYEGVTSARLESVSHERTGVTALTLGATNLAFQFNVLRSVSDNYHIPGKARLNPKDPATNPRGVLPSSWTDRLTASGGVGKFWSKGRIGAAVTLIDSTYGVPFHSDAHSHLGPSITQLVNNVSVGLSQIRLNTEAVLYQPVTAIEQIELRGAHSDYRHAESETASALNNVFRNNESEMKLDITHASLVGIVGRLGATWRNIDFRSSGPEVNTPHTKTGNFAAYLIENYQLGRLKLQLGGRMETQIIDVDFAATRRETLTYDARSLSAGAELNLGNGFELSGNWALARRPPNSAELFANGPHLASGTFEIGGWYRIPFLKPSEGGVDLERSRNYEITLRRTKGRLSGSATWFHYQFDNYHFVSSLGPGWEYNGLPIFRYTQTRARFEGTEVELTCKLLPEDADDRLDLRAMLDSVRAFDINNDTSIPRFPPVRLGTRLEYGHGPWTVGTEVRHAFAQNSLQRNLETPTSPYTMLNADIRYTSRWKRRELAVFLKGSNLLNSEARNHVSFAKDVAPLPGRSIGLGLTCYY